ncbi:MAG: bifunctional 5,10-methylene-tetrahydrofolate dehydrogenase/5,10-methylene-tetrahydrofolate cyclohydrolase [Oscillospiraceae bacterium]|nr:bifunctional 5,10-methylene-tetrahydrofolate dehydrogenase/5,10-methylene-tetrahydrofolate cyclohydrolase [Oscillospiraceae bacterium]
MAKLLKGADVVSALGEKMKSDVENLKQKGVSPTLATLRVGERADDISYEKSAIKRCDSVGVAVKSVVFPEDVSQAELLKCVHELNDNNEIHGVLMFRPLPKHICEDTLRNALSPEKDIDGITDGSLAGVFAGNSNGFAPCTAQACIEILDFYGIDCTGKKAVVIGRSLVVGKPVAIMLMGKNATVTVCHTRTVDIPSIARDADILIIAAGRAESITKEFLSSNQVVIDVGINWNDEKGKLVGDVKFDEAEPIVGAITPVPGGVGTVTTSVLVSNVVTAAKNLRNGH